MGEERGLLRAQSPLSSHAMTDSAPPTETGCTPAPTAAAQVRHFRYYDLVMAAFVAILLLSNLIGASKPSYIPMPDGSQWAFGGGRSGERRVGQECVNKWRSR